MNDNPFVGKWSYRSFYNEPEQFLEGTDKAKKCEELLALVFGSGTIEIVPSSPNVLSGTIGGSGWSLALTGSRSYGNPMEARFQGKGVVSGAEWIYDYVGYLVPEWPNGVQ